MRDIQFILNLWGSWAASNNSGVGWPSVSAGFKVLVSNKSRSRQQCCDDDGLVIDSIVSKLKRSNEDTYELLVLYYVFGFSFRKIAKIKKCSDTHVGKRLQSAEGFICGCLAMLDIKLECD